MQGMTQTSATPTSTSPVAQRAIDTIVIHCSATHSGQPLGNGTYGSAAAVIDRWHASRGFARQSVDVQRYNPSLKSIGYHFVIDVDGTCEIGRSIQEVGAHAAGNNARSIGICMVGGIERDGLYTLAQWGTLRDLVRSLKTPQIKRVVGHRDLSPDANGDGIINSRDWLKTCPGFDVQEWVAADMRPLAKHVWVEAVHA
jgi:N-acetyl-anhydromuramyl-L-alanine amidase AmpD